MKKKYLVIPGWIKSANDGEVHWVGASTLMRLYRVNPAECVIAASKGRQGADDLTHSRRGSTGTTRSRSG